VAAGARSSGRAGRECWRGPHLGASARAMRPARGKGSRTLPRRGPWGEREGGQEGALRPRGLQKEGWGLERVRRPSVGRNRGARKKGQAGRRSIGREEVWSGLEENRGCGRQGVRQEGKVKVRH
jgi:hypothetical protein